MPNLSIDVYSPGSDVTARATAAITGNTFVKIAGPRTENLITAAPADPGGRSAGVAKYDAKVGENVGLARGAARIVRVTAGASLTAGIEVEVGTGGKAVPLATGKPVGYAVDSAASGTLAPISLYA